MRIIALSELRLSCELSKSRTVLGMLELVIGVRVRAVIQGLAVWPSSQTRYFLKLAAWSQYCLAKGQRKSISGLGIVWLPCGEGG